MKRTPRTARGTATRARILEAAETVFAKVGYTDASIVRITEEAGVGQGTFYLYFESKLQVFEELIEDLNRRVRRAMSEAAARGNNRMESERLGFQGFFEFTAAHPALYRIIREAESVSPRALRLHYTRIVEGYIQALDKAQADGEINSIDPTVAAWMLMGIGEMIGMRWVLWGNGFPEDSGSEPPAAGASQVPTEVLDDMMRFIRGGLGNPAATTNQEAGQ